MITNVKGGDDPVGHIAFEWICELLWEGDTGSDSGCCELWSAETVPNVIKENQAAMNKSRILNLNDGMVG